MEFFRTGKTWAHERRAIVFVAAFTLMFAQPQSSAAAHPQTSTAQKANGVQASVLYPGEMSRSVEIDQQVVEKLLEVPAKHPQAAQAVLAVLADLLSSYEREFRAPYILISHPSHDEAVRWIGHPKFLSSQVSDRNLWHLRAWICDQETGRAIWRGRGTLRICHRVGGGFPADFCPATRRGEAPAESSDSRRASRSGRWPACRPR